MDQRTYRRPVQPAVRRRRRRRKLRPQFVAFVFILLLAAAGFIAYRVLYGSRVYTRVTVEAGDVELTAQDFAKNGAKVSFAPDFSLDSVDFHTPGDYPVKLKSGVFSYTVTLTVRDTVAPTARAVPVAVSLGEKADPEEFVTDLEDETRVTVSFEKEPDSSALGTRDVTVVLTDLGGNTARIPVTFTVIPLHAVLEWEAGTDAPRVWDFALPGSNLAVLFSADEKGDPANVDFAALTQTPGDHVVYFMADGLFCRCVFRVKDTTAPALTLRDAVCGVGVTVPAEQFVTEAKDCSPVRLSVTFSASLEQEGSQEVTVRAEDAYGNVSEGKAKLTLVKDTVPPVLYGADDFVTYVGKTVSYLKGVWAEDALDPMPTISVDTNAVDTRKEGKYRVVYVASDASGNRTEKTITLTVLTETISEEEVMKAAQAVLDGIITPNMAPYDKIVAIYNWIRSNVSYKDAATVVDWQAAAYQGLTKHWGDCSVFQMTSRALLTAAGIDNLLIDTVPYYNVHYWNLVNIGDGWYHFDATPFHDGKKFCYIDSATLAKRSTNYTGSHTFDKDRFSFVQ